MESVNYFPRLPFTEIFIPKIKKYSKGIPPDECRQYVNSLPKTMDDVENKKSLYNLFVIALRAYRAKHYNRTNIKRYQKLAIWLDEIYGEYMIYHKFKFSGCMEHLLMFTCSQKIDRYNLIIRDKFKQLSKYRREKMFEKMCWNITYHHKPDIMKNMVDTFSDLDNNIYVFVIDTLKNIPPLHVF
jgi:hypothetical protein